MTPSLLKEVGTTLYGSRWQSELARELKVRDRAVRHWIAGKRPIPDIVDKLFALLKEKEREALETRQKLAKRLS